MATETPAEVTGDHPKDALDGDFLDHVDRELFEGSTDSLERFTARKKALAHPIRYALLYYLYVASDGDESRPVPRKTLKRLSKREHNALQTHVRPLLRTNLLAEVPAPDGADGRETFYRLTTLGKREIESDLWNVRDERPG